MQVLALVLAIGAAVQTLRTYASDSSVLSVEGEEHKLSQLMDIRKEVNASCEAGSFDYSSFSEEFPGIKNCEELNEAIARQALRYIQAIGAKNALIKVIKQPEFETLRDSEPGI